VQELLAGHALSGDRSHKHQHYLKGSIFCGDCGRRLIYRRHRGNGGVYEYFCCGSRDAKGEPCESRRHIPVDVVERAIERYYVGIQLRPRERELARGAVTDYAQGQRLIARDERDRHERRLEDLLVEERKLLQLHYREDVSEAVFALEQERIRTERSAAERMLDQLDFNLADLDEALTEALALLTETHLRYAEASDHGRRLLNQALFEKLLIVDEWVIDCEEQPWVRGLHQLARATGRKKPACGAEKTSGAETAAAPVFSGGRGSYVIQMVRRRGLEPPRGNCPTRPSGLSRTEEARGRSAAARRVPDA
jgi:site-specific DNA recombinase